MSYKKAINKNRELKNIRRERQEKEKNRMDNIKSILLKNKEQNLPSLNIHGYRLDELNNVVEC